MPPLSSRTSDVLNVEPYYTKEYISRCRVRALRHFPVEKRMQPTTFGFDADFIVPEWKECISDKTNLSHRLPYRKPHKMIRNLRKSRRKQHCENDASDAFHQIMDLDRLASTITHTVTENVDVRIKDLLDRIQFEIFKHKSKFRIAFDFEYDILASIYWPHYRIFTPILAFIFAELSNRSIASDINPLSLDATDFDCVLCYRTLWKPVVTPCGHTYCMVSIAQWLQSRPTVDIAIN